MRQGEETRAVEQRARIDSETVKGLLAINGGGAIAMLGFLQAIIDKPHLAPLAHGTLIALVAFPVGIVAALLHNILRRACSAVYDRAWQEQHPRPRPCWIFRIELRDPCVCLRSRAFRMLSILCFCAGCGAVAVQGFVVLARPSPRIAQSAVVVLEHERAQGKEAAKETPSDISAGKTQ